MIGFLSALVTNIGSVCNEKPHKLLGTQLFLHSMTFMCVIELGQFRFDICVSNMFPFTTEQ